MRVGAAAVLAFVALVLFGGPAVAAVEPVPDYSCAVTNGDGTYTFFFSYSYAGSSAVDIPVGTSNHFTPGNDDQGQPTHFTSGTSTQFGVTTTDNRVVWHLGKTNLIANANVLCTSPPVVSEAASRLLLPLAAALPFAAWFVRGRRRNRLVTA